MITTQMQRQMANDYLNAIMVAISTVAENHEHGMVNGNAAFGALATVLGNGLAAMPDDGLRRDLLGQVHALIDDLAAQPSPDKIELRDASTGEPTQGREREGATTPPPSGTKPHSGQH